MKEAEPKGDALHIAVANFAVMDCQRRIHTLDTRDETPTRVLRSLKDRLDLTRFRCATTMDPELATLHERIAQEEASGMTVTRFFPTARNLKRAFDGSEQFYERYGSNAVAAKEKEYADLIGADTAIFESGMAAFHCILDMEGPHRNVIAAQNVYGHTNELLELRGQRTRRLPTKEIEDAILHSGTGPAEVVFLESIANAPGMEVADLEGIFCAVRKRNAANPHNPTRLIIDHTFLSSALLSLPELSAKYWPKSESPVVGIESATKHYQWGWDKLNAGVVYSSDAEYMQRLREHRSRTGTPLPGRMAPLLPKLDKHLWCQWMLRHSENATALATVFEQELPPGAVSYPGLPSHPYHQRMKSMAPGAGGVFYVQLGAKNGERLVDAMHKASRDIGVPVHIGGSFGHQETSMFSFDRGENDVPNWMMRVASGVEEPKRVAALAEALRKVLRA